MPEITSRLSTALADRYKIERHLGEGPMRRREWESETNLTKGEV